jgi:D-3-phosphoglycerate dehydrogenase
MHDGPLRRALILENPDPVLDEELRGQGIEAIRIKDVPSSDELLDLIRTHRPHLLYKRSRVVIDEAVLNAAEDLFAVMLCCIGDDSVDKDAAAARGVLVLNDPRSNGRSVAEMVIGQLLMGARRLPEAWAATNDNEWTKSSTGRFEVKGKSIGILGLGSIGTQVARLADGLGMRVCFFDDSEIARAVGETMEWEEMGTVTELFARCDVVTIHLSAEDQRGRSNELFVTREDLFALGSGRGDGSPRVLVNLARGFLYEPADLIAAVQAGAVRQAFVDVFPEEPRNAAESWSNPFAGVPGIYCTPHIGAATRDAQPRIGRKMGRSTRLLSERGTVEDCVFAPKRRIGVAASALSPHILAVVHADVRGTKKAVDDAIYAAGVSNLQSAHRDFPRYGIAYDLSVLDRPLSDEEVAGMVSHAAEITGRDDAIRAVRRLTLPG